MKKISEKIDDYGDSWTPDKSMWVKLNRFYNYDNPYDMIFYFYERDKNKEILRAISFGFSDMGVGKQSEAYVMEDIEFGYYDDFIYIKGDSFDELEIYEGELEPSDIDSINEILANVLELPLYDKNNALQKFKQVYKP